ncbi:MAG: SH3 domain-containing protein [Caldilineaceae bacterium SB0666_bin_21]|nr:SH3 domain-containing protein [Caldilineaceae bacterium SB0666_bin_21]
METAVEFRRSCIGYLACRVLMAVVACGLGFGFTWSGVAAAEEPPTPRMDCASELQYVLRGSIPATFNYSSRELAPGLQVCVLAQSGGGAGWSLLKLETETGEVGWIMSRHVGTWQAYLASLDPSLPTPTATARPMHSPTPMPIARATPIIRAPSTPTAVPCTRAWGTHAAGYRVRLGPGTGHAHTGRYVLAGQPVCVLRHDRGWVLVRLADGATGWVHGAGISTPAAVAAAPPPAAIAEPAVAPRQATITATGIVIRNHDYAFSVDIPAGWTQEQAHVADAEWVGEGSLRLRSHPHPDGMALDRLARTIRANLRSDWPYALVFEIDSFEKQEVAGQDRYVLKYRVRERPGACLLDVEEVIMVGGSQLGPARAFRAQHRMCAWEEAESTRRALLDSLSVVAVPSYYAQFLQSGGIWIKAPGQVDPRALHTAADRVELMLARVRHGIPDCLADAGAELAIYPGDSHVTDLPEFADLQGQLDEVGDPYDTYLGLGGIPGQPVSGVPENNLLALLDDGDIWSDVTIHEFAHLIQNLCFTPAEHVQIDALYDRTKRLGRFEDTYAMLNVEEFFAVFTTVYFNASWRLSDFGLRGNWGRVDLRHREPEIFAFMESIFNTD